MKPASLSPQTLIFLALLTLVPLVACGSDDDDDDANDEFIAKLEELDLGRHIGIQPESSNDELTGWVVYSFEDPEEAICLYDTPYLVGVHEGPSDNLMLYLQGGGAGWSDDTINMAFPNAFPPTSSGVNDFNNPDNPLVDWDIVYASYCDGCVFSCDAEQVYNGKPVKHHGLQNLSAAITQMIENFPEPEKILVTGSSAGGYGTIIGGAAVRLQYPDVDDFYVINDSGPGVYNPALVEENELRAENWGYEEFVPFDQCPDCEEQLSFLVDWALESDPAFKAGLFSYLQDSVIGGAFLRMEGPEYESLLREVSGEIHDRHPERFKRFMVEGTGHTALMGDLDAHVIEGVSLREWIGAMVYEEEGWLDLVE